jgi:SAM-dependent methyltransferase
MYSQEETKKFYDKESTMYSGKRYTVKNTYVQYFFQTRLNVVKKFLKKILINDRKTVLDIGCADGVVTRDIFDSFERNIDHMVGVDISSLMISTARQITQSKYKIEYKMKEELTEKDFDIVLAMGYMSLPILEEEIVYLKKHIKTNGIYILTMAGNSSLHAILKVRGKPYFDDFNSYDKYEDALSKHFDILAKRPVGLFIPKLWSVPFIARYLQPFFDSIFRFVVPNLYHEKVYILKLKSDNIK